MATSKKTHILVVDDESSIRHICKTILEYNGYTALTAADGMQAVDVYENVWSKIDLVLLDLSMPLLSGREVLLKILEINPLAKVIICSAYMGVPTEDLIDEGASAILYKPFRPDELLNVIQSTLFNQPVIEHV